MLLCGVSNSVLKRFYRVSWFLGIFIESLVFLGVFIESVVFLGVFIKSVVFLGVFIKSVGLSAQPLAVRQVRRGLSASLLIIGRSTF